jgi:NAD(P)-dependent dehydrogenase (short-subunit alcohol dehydrogenase family)
VGAVTTKPLPTPDSTGHEPHTGEEESESDVTVITGASRGIGAATAIALARRNRAGHIVINYRANRHAARSVADQVTQLGSSASTIRADIGREDDVIGLFDQVDRIGTVTGLVNNAGILFDSRPLREFTVTRLEEMWRVNITGSFLCAREAVRRMATSTGGHGGSIVNVSSRASTFGSPNEYIDYAASKGAIDTMTVGLATEVATEGIRVNAVRPGLIHTDIHASGGRPTRVDDLAAGVPMRRGGRPEEVADLIVWLLSEEASYVTGALIDVGGGR